MWQGKLDASVEQGKATPVHLKKDDVITITVTGKASYGGTGEFGPDGDPNYQNPNVLLPSANVGAVLMRIGNGELKEIGSGVSKHQFQEEGEITFLYNDWPGKFGDNSGSFEVKVEREAGDKGGTGGKGGTQGKTIVWSGTLNPQLEEGVPTTGVTLSPGDVISITVTGEAWYAPKNVQGSGPHGPDGLVGYNNPDSLLPGAPEGAVLMLIGLGDLKVVGSGLSDYTVQEDEHGEITFFYNVHYYRNPDTGKSGSFEITLRK